MRRKHALLLGNFLMGSGMVIMVAGVGCSIINQLPNLNMPQFIAHGAVFSIFIGAILWLIGARISGREKIADRYWWVRRYDRRCCNRKQHRHS